MPFPGSLVCFLSGQTVADSATPALLADARFKQNRNGQILDLFLQLAGTSCTVVPVFRHKQITDDSATPVRIQFDGTPIALTATGNYHRQQIVMPKGFDVALRITAIAGGALTAHGAFSAEHAD